jgi:type I restriction enzyme S subunit
MVKTADFSNGFTKNLTYTDKRGYDFLHNSNLFGGELILSNIGSIGKVFKVPYLGRPMTLASNTVMLKTKDDLLTDYLFHFLQSEAGYKKLMSISSGTSMLKFNKTELKNIDVPYPDRETQMKTVSNMDKLNHLISLRKKQLQKLDDLVKSRFVELFGDKYAEKALIDLCNIIDYRGKTPEKAENGLPFITAKNVKMHYMSLEPREYISKDTYDKVMVRGFPQEGDVVFTTEAPLGNVCRIPHFDTEFYIGQRIVTLQTTALNPTYLEYALSTEEFIKKYMGKSSGSTVTGIRVRLLEQLTIPVPPRSLQDRFAKYVEQADRSKLTVQQGLDKLELLKQSLMQKYFG